MPVVVGFVDTPEGRAALAAGVEEAQLRKTTVIAVDLAAPGGDGKSDGAGASDIDNGAPGSVSVERRVVSGGDSTGALLDIAEQEGAELIIIGLRRRSNVGKLILGAHAQRVLLEAGAPVLTIKPEADNTDSME